MTTKKVNLWRNVVTFFSLSALLSLGFISTQAAWTDEASWSGTVNVGTVNMQVGNGDNHIITFPGTWYPSMSNTQTVAIKNSGNIPLRLSVTPGSVKSPINEKLSIKILEGNYNTLYDGPLDEIMSTLGSNIQPGSSTSYKITLTWVPSGNDEDFINTKNDFSIGFVGISG